MATLVVGSAFSAPALADGGIPRGNGILFEPGNPAHIVIRSIYWGLFEERSGTNGFNLLCSQAYGGRALVAEDHPTVVTLGGRILVANDFAGLISSDDSCEWKQIDAFNGESVETIAPVDATGKNFVAVTVQGANAGVTSRVYSSADRGDTWTRLKGTLTPNLSISGVAVAPSDPMRIYAVGVMIDGGPRMIAVSADGGATFNMLPMGATTEYDATQVTPLSVVGIVPDDPDTLFVRANGSDNPGFVLADELWVSSDAGKTWKKSYQPGDMHDLPGFAFTPDGKSVLISGPGDGIQQASLADAVAAKAGAFTQIYKGAVWGLTFNDGKLYAGNDDYGMKPPFMLGVSTDLGKTFSPLLNHCNVSFPTCNAMSTMTQVCTEQWTRSGGYKTDYVDTCHGGAAGSAGAAGAGGASGAGGTSAGGTTGGGMGGTMTSVVGGADASAPNAGASEAGHVSVKSGACSMGGAPSSSSASTMLMIVATATLGAARRRKAARDSG
ncbi:MAG TPA: hypothetical protein VH062_05565 [Polyangiaceae bacterium]|nr:hypothetical protein [Polyangiaceae bacterium]